MVVLLIAGLQVPEILFVDVVIKGEMLAPLQNGPTGLKVGVTAWLTVRFTVVCVDVQLPRALGPTT